VNITYVLYPIHTKNSPVAFNYLLTGPGGQVQSVDQVEANAPQSGQQFGRSHFNLCMFNC
jgi:hypothetical protein